jgi:hypothetical protein
MLPHSALFCMYLNMFCSTFRRLRKIANSDYYLFISVRLSVSPHGTTRFPLGGGGDFYEIWYWSIFWKFFKNILLPLKSVKNNVRVLCMKTNLHFWSYLAQFFLQWDVFQTKITEKIKTHILNNFLSESRTVYEIMWKNIVQPGRLKMTIWRMPIACSITMATNVHSAYVILIALHCNNGCTRAPKCYVTPTLPVFLELRPVDLH